MQVLNRETIATHKLCSIIGFQVTAKFLKSIGCLPAVETKTGVFWFTSDIDHIVSSLIHHLKHIHINHE
jgi:hypothetical protein